MGTMQHETTRPETEYFGHNDIKSVETRRDGSVKGYPGSPQKEQNKNLESTLDRSNPQIAEQEASRDFTILSLSP